MDHVLITKRLVLRPVTADDQATLLAHWALPDVRRFLFDGAALSAAEVAATIEESVRDFAAAGYGIWLILRQDRPGPASTVLIGTHPRVAAHRAYRPGSCPRTPRFAASPESS